jgi:hypothetical protein
VTDRRVSSCSFLCVLPPPAPRSLPLLSSLALSYLLPFLSLFSNRKAATATRSETRTPPRACLSNGAPSSASTSSTSSGGSSSSPSLGSASLDASWSSVLSLLPAESMGRNNGSDLLRMRVLYAQLKAAREKQRTDELDAAKKVRREEKRRKKKEKKRKRKAKRAAKKAEAAAAAAAAFIAAGGDPATVPNASSSDSDSDSDSSSDED